MEDDYSAVLLYYKGSPSVEHSIDDLLRQTAPPTAIIIVDNNSGDGVIDEIIARRPELAAITLDRNLGYAGGMNVGISACTTNWVLLVTHEVRMNEDCVETMLDVANSDPTIVQVGPILKLVDSDTVWSVGGEITPSGAVRHPAPRHDGLVRDVDWLDGACQLVNAEALHLIGLLDERYFLYWEDVALSRQLSRLGRVVVAIGAVAEQGTSRTPVYFKARNRVLFWRAERSSSRVAAAVTVTLFQLFRDAFRRDGVVLRARFVGLLDGFSGSLHPAHYSARER